MRKVQDAEAAAAEKLADRKRKKDAQKVELLDALHRHRAEAKKEAKAAKKEAKAAASKTASKGSSGKRVSFA